MDHGQNVKVSDVKLINESKYHLAAVRVNFMYNNRCYSLYF